MSNDSILNQGIALAYLAELPRLSLVCNEGRWYRYDKAHGWRFVATKTVECALARFIIDYLNDSRTWTGKAMSGTSFTHSRVKDVLACLGAMQTVLCDEEPSLDPSMLLVEEGHNIVARPMPGWIATTSHLLHTAKVATAMHRNEDIPANAVFGAASKLFSPGCVPCRFDPQAKCPRWEKFIGEVCPDDAKTLQMGFGLSLTYDRRYNVFFMVYGEAGTGKSTALSILERLNTGVKSSISLSLFGERFQDYPLTHNRLNLVPDMDAVSAGGAGVTRRESVLKSCTCGEMHTVEQKNEAPEQRYLTALPFFGCNTLARLADRSNAISDRMRIISFPNVFRGTASQDNNLIDALMAELPGILNWSLRGLGELLASGVNVFPESESAKRLKAESIKASRPEELFCDEYLEPAAGEYLPTTIVYDYFARFCVRNGYPPPDSGVVIPAICRYLGVAKERRCTPSGRKFCLVGTAFQQWVLKHSEYQG